MSGTKKNILLTCKQRVRGGGQEKNYYQIASELQDRYNFSFLMAGGYQEDDLSDIGTVYTFPGKGRWLFSPLDLTYLIYVSIKEKIDIAHAHHRYAAFLGTLASKIVGFKQITTAHNVFPDKSSISLFGDHVIAVSHAVKSWLVDECNLAPESITVIHNGIPQPEKYGEEQLAILKKSLVGPDTKHTLITVGRLLPQKNYPLLIRALSKLQAQHWHLLIIGEGDDREDLIKLSQSLGLESNISFLGFRRDVDKLLQLSDIYVMSSSWEGLPYVLVESLANDLPVVATDVGGVKEAIIDGVTGTVIPASNENLLTDSIDKLIENESLRYTYSINCNKQFRDNFLDKMMFETTEKCYKELLDR